MEEKYGNNIIGAIAHKRFSFILRDIIIKNLGKSSKIIAHGT
jgi:hypothetical protein